MEKQRSQDINPDAESIAGEVLSLCRSLLIAQLRFLGGAICALTPASTEAFPSCATDGRRFFFNSLWLFRAFNEARDSVTHAYLHVTLHCVFRHMFIGDVDAGLWDVACDVAVWQAIEELGIGAAGPRLRRNAYLARLKAEIGSVTAERVYHALRAGTFTEDEIGRMRELFFVDCHDLWHSRPQGDGREEEQDERGRSAETREENEDAGGVTPTEEESRENDTEAETSDEDKEAGENEGAPDGEEKPAGGGQGSETGDDDAGGESVKKNGSASRGENPVKAEPGNPAPGRGDKLSEQELEDEWKQIAERAEIMMGFYQGQRGTESGGFSYRLRIADSRRVSCRTFLRKFTDLREVLQINDNEFDYAYYSHGLHLYKNIPLVEPLEYKEDRRIRQLVLAVDTSASVKGEPLAAFVQKAYDILCERESFADRFDVWIIQCDAEVRKVMRLKNRRDIEGLKLEGEAKGLGGTDFRPVFRYVEDLKKQGELTQLKGLLYFTDGDGVYPAKKPDYDVAFVFVREPEEGVEIPAWAIRYIWSEEE